MKRIKIRTKYCNLTQNWDIILYTSHDVFYEVDWWRKCIYLEKPSTTNKLNIWIEYDY
jgi:hypothetical protein